MIFHSKHIKITVFYSVLCLSECQTLGKTLFFNEILKGNDLCKCMWMNICNTFFKNQQNQFSRGLAENQKKTIFQRSCRKQKKQKKKTIFQRACKKPKKKQFSRGLGIWGVSRKTSEIFFCFFFVFFGFFEVLEFGVSQERVLK